MPIGGGLKYIPSRNGKSEQEVSREGKNVPVVNIILKTVRDLIFSRVDILIAYVSSSWEQGSVTWANMNGSLFESFLQKRLVSY